MFNIQRDSIKTIRYFTWIKRTTYTKVESDIITTQLNNLINTQQDTKSTTLGDGVDLLWSPSVLSKVIAGDNIKNNSIFNAGELDDGQIKFNVDLSNHHVKIYVDSTLATTADGAIIIAGSFGQIKIKTKHYNWRSQ